MASTYRQAVAVTPSDDSGDNYAMADMIYVGSGGDVSVVDAIGGETVFTNVPDGSYLPLRSVRVNSTDTTATDIVALYK